MTTITRHIPRIAGFHAAHQDDIGFCVLAELDTAPGERWLSLFAVRCDDTFSRHTSPDIRWVEGSIWFRVPSADLVSEYARLIVSAVNAAGQDEAEEQAREAERARVLAQKTHDLDDLLNTVNAALPDWMEGQRTA
ncbi:hypothetical protein L2Y96_14475 [Luteibacter aegosomaticola]|jgi:hypothetical protein|uniref:hypothetical protein n=1 Tax=Luteibacter aegosomaticola TaxID=2911538 RepID=UPI001FF7618F|nr:hypothetical protein [Luteibacter aegosomaticola]UPG88621.1 hypothetical protein L2Y96_14475 [Luteibacter aegosomaticola]